MTGAGNIAKLPEVKKRISLSLKGKPRPSIRGPNHWAWTGGDTRVDPDFLLVRPAILKRDGHCQLCGATKKLLVHHQDRNKFNSIPENLVVLCRSCHRRVHNRVPEELITSDAVSKLKTEDIVKQGRRFDIAKSAKGHLRLMESIKNGLYW